MNFALRLRELRQQHNPPLSQAALASELERNGCTKISKSSINMYERGEREPGFETLEAIANYFNVDMNCLTGWSDIPREYDRNPETRLSTMPASIFIRLQQACNNNRDLIWHAWNAIRYSTTAEKAVAQISFIPPQKVIDLFNLNLDIEADRFWDNMDFTISDTDPQINHILSNADVLNAQGLSKLEDYSDDLVSSGKYQRRKPLSEN